MPFTAAWPHTVHSSSLPFCVRFKIRLRSEPPYTYPATLDTGPVANGYPGGSLPRSSSNHFQYARALSVFASLLSLLLFYLYGHWHWQTGPWQLTIPGRLGLSWVATVDGSKMYSMLLALISLVITIALFRKKGRFQGLVSLPPCLLSLMTVPIVT
jgi:hypothetical protein